MPFARILRSSALMGGAQVVVMAPASKSDVQYPLQLGWAPRADLQSGLRQIVGRYLPPLRRRPFSAGPIAFERRARA